MNHYTGIRIMEAAAHRTGAGVTALLQGLQSAIAGEVRADRLTRAIYATDASIYEIVPDAVVFPKTVADVAAAIRLCGQHGTAVTARGAGTGLTGGAVNYGIQLDCSRHLNRIRAIDTQARTARVEPGVVLDELNAALTPHGLQFAPDVATSSRATIGGMIANNSCGAHSVWYGRTVDHVQAVDVVLSDGSTCTFGPGCDTADNPLGNRCSNILADVAQRYADQIAARFPKVMRSNGGYGLDRLRTDDGRVNTEAIICGSEGTLCVVVGAMLNLVPLPAYRGLVIAHFHELSASLAAAPIALEHKPAAVELVDKLILDAAIANPTLRRKCAFIEGDPAAVLIIELFDQDEAVLKRRLRDVAADVRARAGSFACPVVSDPACQEDVWEVRKAGLGLLMSKPGDQQPYAFVEDTAVAPAKLRDYIERFRGIVEAEGVEQAGYYAHASVGCLHVRPVLNLKEGRDVKTMHRIADKISSLALEYGGAMTGEHGDGIVRSCWLKKMYGPEIIEAFGRIKDAFDPGGILNPGKIVSPKSQTDNLRYGADFETQPCATTLDFSAHGGMAALAGMCSGVGQCRQRLVGTMCPSFLATCDERHTTRARANALRMALSNRGLIQGLSDPSLQEVMDLCLSCKACKTECPTGTDLAKLKAEWLSFRNRHLGVSPRSRLMAASADLARWGCTLAPVSNWVIRSRLARALLERRFGLDRRMPPPRFVRQTFRKWFARYRRRRDRVGRPDQPRVVYFVDTWTNHYAPQVGRAMVKVLEAMGYRVIVPPANCCGRPLISQGLLAEAKLLARRNASILGPLADRGMTIVGTEPSCVSALTDEMPDLVRTPQARRAASRTVNVDTFIARALEDTPGLLRFGADLPQLLYHGHCHQKALTGTDDAMKVLRICARGAAAEINSGCCGMAGSFGHEVEHYDIAQAIGEQQLFPAVRHRGQARIVVSGFSCRQQIEHHTGRQAKHLIEHIADALV